MTDAKELSSSPGGRNEAPAEISYQELFEHMLHEVHVWRLVRDKDGAIETWRLVGANPAALNAWDKTLPEVVGKTANEIFGVDATSIFMPVVKQVFDEMRPHDWEQEFPATGQMLHMVTVPFGEFFLSTGYDITEQKRVADERDELLGQLQEALKEARILQGLVPICACCKKIRDNESHWVSLERYLTEHTRADLSHDYCPECYEKALKNIDPGRDRGSSEYKLRERIKELDCIYKASKILKDATLSVEEMLAKILHLLPPAWQYPEATCARITVKDIDVMTSNYAQTEWKLSSDIEYHGRFYGTVEVRYLKKFEDEDEDVFQKEERHLIDEIAERVALELYSRELRITGSSQG